MPPTITLYQFPPSQNAIRTEIALREKRLAFERVTLDLTKGEHRRPPLSEVSPRMQVPTLVWDDGSGPIVVYESLATIRFLDDVHPEPPLMPPVTDPRRRATALIRLEEFQAKLDPKNVFGSALFRGMDRQALGTRVDDLLAEIPRWDAYVGDQPFLAGDAFTLADIAVFPLLMHFEHLGYDYARHTPALAGYVARCKARPSVAESGWLENLAAFVDRFSPAKVLAQ